MSNESGVKEFLSLDSSKIWEYQKNQSFSFWMVCLYLLFEYTRPQSIFPQLDFLPWMQVFLVLGFLGLFFGSQKSKRNHIIVWFWLITLLVTILLSSALGIAPSISWRNLENYYIWLIVILLISRAVTDQRQLFILLIIFWLASFKLSFFGARLFVSRGFAYTGWGIMGPPGFFQNSGELATQMVVFFGLSFYAWLALRDHVPAWKGYILLLGPITSALTVIGASSRGAQLALALQIIFIVLHRRISFKVFAVAIVAGVLTFSLIPEQQMERFSDIGEDRTSQQRLLYWENGWEMMKAYPFLGVGYFNFATYFEKKYPNDMLYDGAQLAHNIFIQVGADLGFVGLFVYLCLVALSLRIPLGARRELRQQYANGDWRSAMALGLVVGYLGFLVAGQFVSIVYYPFMWIHLAFCMALSNTLRKKSSDRRLQPQLRED